MVDHFEYTNTPTERESLARIAAALERIADADASKEIFREVEAVVTGVVLKTSYPGRNEEFDCKLRVESSALWDDPPRDGRVVVSWRVDECDEPRR